MYMVKTTKAIRQMATRKDTYKPAQHHEIQVHSLKSVEIVQVQEVDVYRQDN